MVSLKPVRGVVCLGLLAGLAAGCDSLIRPAGPAAQEPTEFTTVRLPGVSVEAARTAGLAAMKEHFRVDTTASTGTVLISRPLETTGRASDEPPAVREIISGSSNRHRQTAQIRFGQRGGDLVARIHVQVQRLDVVERSAFMGQRGAEDRPSNLPGEQYPANRTLTEQDWVNVGRNRELEQTIADSIAERLASQTAGGAAPAATTRPQ